MNTATKALSWIALVYSVSSAAMAQQPASSPAAAPVPDASAASQEPARAAPARAKASAQTEAGEPRANTLNSAATDSPPPAATPSADRPASAPAAHAPAARTAPGAAQKLGPKTDRLELGTATVTGSQEQPKVMYIVPWKRSDIGDLSGKPMNSLVDEILAPVDRDVFKREVLYYHAVQADTSQNGAPPKPAQQGEK